MLNRFCWLAALPTILFWALPGLADDNQELAHFIYPSTLSSELNRPICYMQTDSGEIVDLEHLCNVATNNLDNSIVETSDLEIFSNRSVNQGKTCYFVDSSGRPCG